MALLRMLVDRAGALVSKDALMEAAWPGLAVEDSNLTVQIAALRRALAEVPGGESWIATLPVRAIGSPGPLSPRARIEYPLRTTISQGGLHHFAAMQLMDMRKGNPGSSPAVRTPQLVLSLAARLKSHSSVTSLRYFSYSALESRLPSRSTRARSFAGKEACISETRFQGAIGVSHVERGTNSDGCTLL